MRLSGSRQPAPSRIRGRPAAPKPQHGNRRSEGAGPRPGNAPARTSPRCRRIPGARPRSIPGEPSAGAAVLSRRGPKSPPVSSVQVEACGISGTNFAPLCPIATGREKFMPTANPKPLTATANRLILAADERSLQVDLVRLDRTVQVAGCAGSRDPGPSTPTQRAAAQIPEAVGVWQY